MDIEIKSELWNITVAMLGAVPVLGALGFTAVTGLVGM